MLGQESYVEIQVKHRQGMSIKAISRELKMSRNTVRRYVRAKTMPKPKQREAKPTKLQGYRGYLKARVGAAAPDWIPARVLFDEITALGYTAYSRPSLPLIPAQSCHLFQTKAATHSTAKLPPQQGSR
jgi:transposase